MEKVKKKKAEVFFFFLNFTVHFENLSRMGQEAAWCEGEEPEHGVKKDHTEATFPLVSSWCHMS